MAAYDDIYSLSTENHGIVTTRDARGLNVRDSVDSAIEFVNNLIRKIDES